MNKFKKVASLVTCVVMLICLLSVNSTAATGTATESTSVRSSHLLSYTATAKLTVTENSALATLYYETVADSMTINMTIDVKNTSTGLESSYSPLAVIETSTAYAFKSVSAGTNEEFTGGYSVQRVSTYWQIGELRLFL